MLSINEEEDQSLLLNIDNNDSIQNHPRLRRLKKCFKREYNQNFCNFVNIENCIILFICILTLISTIVIIAKCFLSL